MNWPRAIDFNQSVQPLAASVCSCGGPGL